MYLAPFRLLVFLAVMTMAGGAVFSVTAGEHRFFRVVGATNSVITAFGGDGTLVWSSAVARATCTVQRAFALGAATNWQDYVQVSCTSQTTTARLFDLNAPTGMVFIPDGIFQMGDNLGDGWYLEQPVRIVFVSACYMDQTGVTWDQWQVVRGWSITNGYDLAGVGTGKVVNHPVYNVNWYDCVKWCNARSQQAGLTPCYTWNGSVYTNGQHDDIVCNWSANGYRLPTEAEREKAARSGLVGKRFPWGDTIDHSLANYCGYPDVFPTYDLGYAGYDTRFEGVFPYTSPAGSFAANGYGLFDMCGNLFEWCWDWFDEYATDPMTDPQGPSAASDHPEWGSTRVARGGDWYVSAWYARLAYRTYYGPSSRGNDRGFRTVRH